MHGKAIMELRDSIQTRHVMTPLHQQEPQTGMMAGNHETTQQHQDIQVARQGMESLPKQAWKHQESKPVVLLIGNSLVRIIKESALSTKCTVKKIAAEYIGVVHDSLVHYDGQAPTCVAIQAITNEARNVNSANKHHP